MRDDKLIRWILGFYTALVFLFVFAPIMASLVFSFNSDRFPTIPLGSFTTDWYVKAFSNPEAWDAALRSLVVSSITAVIATAIGFSAAYSDYRYDFFGKKAFMTVSGQLSVENYCCSLSNVYDRTLRQTCARCRLSGCRRRCAAPS